MATRTPSATKSRRRQNRGRRPHHPRPAGVEAKQEHGGSEEQQAFLFDPYWDEVFAAYYEPYLRTCCPIR